MIRGGGCRVIEVLQAPSIKFRVRADDGRRDGVMSTAMCGGRAIGTSSMDNPLGAMGAWFSGVPVARFNRPRATPAIWVR